MFCILGDGLMKYDKIDKVMDSKQFGRIVRTPKIDVRFVTVRMWYEATALFYSNVRFVN